MTLTATQIASVVKGTSLTAYQHTITFQATDEPIAVAVALANQHRDANLPRGYWGLGKGPAGIDDEARSLAAWLGSEAQYHRDGWRNVPGKADGAYLLFMPEATAAIASAPAGDNSKNLDTGPLNPSNPNNALSGALSPLGDVVDAGTTALKDIVDPLFWRQLAFIAGGWMLIGVAVFQLANKSLIAPVQRGLYTVDSIAMDAASLKTFVGKPLSAYVKQRRASAPARAQARGAKLLNFAGRSTPNSGTPANGPARGRSRSGQTIGELTGRPGPLQPGGQFTEPHPPRPAGHAKRGHIRT